MWTANKSYNRAPYQLVGWSIGSDMSDWSSSLALEEFGLRHETGIIKYLRHVKEIKSECISNFKMKKVIEKLVCLVKHLM